MGICDIHRAILAGLGVSIVDFPGEGRFMVVIPGELGEKRREAVRRALFEIAPLAIQIDVVDRIEDDRTVVDTEGVELLPLLGR